MASPVFTVLRSSTAARQGNGVLNRLTDFDTWRQRANGMAKLIGYLPASRGERGPDHFRQIGLAIWLGEQEDACIETAITDHRAFRIAGRI